MIGDGQRGGCDGGVEPVRRPAALAQSVADARNAFDSEGWRIIEVGQPPSLGDRPLNGVLTDRPPLPAALYQMIARHGGAARLHQHNQHLQHPRFGHYVDELGTVIGQSLDACTPPECANDFAAGYDVG